MDLLLGEGVEDAEISKSDVFNLSIVSDFTAASAATGENDVETDKGAVVVVCAGVDVTPAEVGGAALLDGVFSSCQTLADFFTCGEKLVFVYATAGADVVDLPPVVVSGWLTFEELSDVMPDDDEVISTKDDLELLSVPCFFGIAEVVRLAPCDCMEDALDGRCITADDGLIAVAGCTSEETVCDRGVLEFIGID